MVLVLRNNCRGSRAQELPFLVGSTQGSWLMFHRAGLEQLRNHGGVSQGLLTSWEQGCFRRVRRKFLLVVSPLLTRLNAEDVPKLEKKNREATVSVPGP